MNAVWRLNVQSDELELGLQHQRFFVPFLCVVVDVLLPNDVSVLRQSLADPERARALSWPEWPKVEGQQIFGSVSATEVEMCVGKNVTCKFGRVQC